MKPLIVIAGPTGVGKTELAHMLAIELNGEIISADSRQVYRYMDIGTAKPDKSLQNQLKYHLIDVVTPDENFTVADFKKHAEEIISLIHNKKKLPFLVGGTGLYIKAIVSGLFPSPTPSLEIRQELQQQIYEFGPRYIYDQLCQIDKEKAEKLNPNDTRRVIRALEVFYQTGIPISRLQKLKTQKKDYKLIMICLNKDRDKLYQQINERVDRMIKEGFVDEVRTLLKMGYDENLISMEAVGYKQIIAYLKGRCSLNEAIEIIKKLTRNFAKRQLTWFRAEKRFNWFLSDDKDKIYEFIIKNLNAGK